MYTHTLLLKYTQASFLFTSISLASSVVTMQFHFSEIMLSYSNWTSLPQLRDWWIFLIFLSFYHSFYHCNNRKHSLIWQYSIIKSSKWYLFCYKKDQWIKMYKSKNKPCGNILQKHMQHILGIFTLHFRRSSYLFLGSACPLNQDDRLSRY